MPVHMIHRARRRLVENRCTNRLSADDTMQTKATHQSLDCTAGNHDPLASHLAPDLADAINLVVLCEHACDRRLEVQITLRPR